MKLFASHTTVDSSTNAGSIFCGVENVLPVGRKRTIRTSSSTSVFKPFLHEHGQQIVLNVYNGLLEEYVESVALMKTCQLAKVCEKTVTNLFEKVR